MEPATLATAFSMWAAVVGMIGIAIVWELYKLRAELKELRTDLNEHMLNTERRVTHVESHLQSENRDFVPWRKS